MEGQVGRNRGNGIQGDMREKTASTEYHMKDNMETCSRQNIQQL